MGWAQQTDSAGHVYDVCFQDHNYSCFAASCGMVYRLLKGRRPPETLGRWAVEIATNENRGGGAFAFRDWNQSGTLLSVLQRALTELGISSTLHRSTVTAGALIGMAMPTKPAICQVELAGGGLHSIVSVGRFGNNLVILDPDAGLQEPPQGQFPAYHRTFSNGVTDDCTFSAYTVMCG